MVLDANDTARLEAKISAAERKACVQIVVAVARGPSWLGIHRKASKLFRKHHLERTRNRNGVLLLLVPRDREFLVYGDQAIHDAVGQHYWDDLQEGMSAYFREGRFYEGLSLAVGKVADRLEPLFPPQHEVADELPNRIIFTR